MDFSFTEEQSLLRDSLAAFLADRYDFETRRKVTRAAPGWRPEIWRALAEELGILGASFPEDMGGLGGGPIETLVIMEEFGKALVVEPYVPTVVIAGGVFRREGSARARAEIEKIVSGQARWAFAWAETQARYCLNDLAVTARKQGAGWLLNGAKAVVQAAPFAERLLVTARTGGTQREPRGVSLFAVDKSAKGVVARDYPTVDGSRASEIAFEDVSLPADALVGPEGEALPLVEAVVDEAVAATCAEAVGVLRKLHEGTLEYTRNRKQFGQPIASFQVLQHRMVDMFIQLEQAVSMTYMAHIRLGEAAAERAKAVSAAKVQVGRACRFVGQNAIQLHGGMGMTDEMAIGHYFKRATLIEGAFGSTDHHLARYEGLSFPDAA
ncbi:MAG TPA: acyl-CoA dehydrogenase family protein [Caulobacteraceae bacterium]|nr:acyl-CoA dehydrogenase family protein [Caulobacteraceae bacterium]